MSTIVAQLKSCNLEQGETDYLRLNSHPKAGDLAKYNE